MSGKAHFLKNKLKPSIVHSEFQNSGLSKRVPKDKNFNFNEAKFLRLAGEPVHVYRFGCLNVLT